jgi:hypothetical protein
MKKDYKTTYIKKFLEETHVIFPQLKFRCEFSLLSSTYIVEVKPLSVFTENEQYGKLEYDFAKEFESKFAGYMIMFVSDDSLNKVENPILEIGYDLFSQEFKNEPIKTISFDISNGWIHQNEDKIALAA